MTRHTGFSTSMARWIAVRLGTAGLLALAILLILDAVFPLPRPEADKDFAVAVVAEDGTPLRSFPDEKGVWRYPVDLAHVSPLYLEALIEYEDRWFWRHPGVNPWALARAAARYCFHGRPVTGGSTLTMQVARILDPHGRTIPGKIKQIFRALQLEWHYDKKEILTLYLNYAPFGGPIEGVQAAAFAYLGKSAQELTQAEAALLAVLPQAPSRLRPDRHPDRATKARDKVLDRLARSGKWSTDDAREARREKVTVRFDPRPMQAPILADHLRCLARPGAPVRTTIDIGLQQSASELVQGFIAATPERVSAAVLIVENRNLAVRAYVGSADFLDENRFGHVDMVRAYRSPGSLLKPLLYGLALEEGLIHSESLLIDAPLVFPGYKPINFSEGFSGPVSVSEALNRSLNIPAVDTLDRLGSNFFDTRLRQGGLVPRYPHRSAPNVTMILGGIGLTLEDLVGAYVALARGGLSGRPRYTPETPLRERRLLSPGAAYIIRQILMENPRPDFPGERRQGDGRRGWAWKTGTSYGFRDAWAIGVGDDFTVGVWAGRPDATPVPGQYGRITAGPLLFRLRDSLPRFPVTVAPVPETVARVEICWPLGIRPTGPEDPLCQQRRVAWVLGGAIPPTLPDRADRHWLGNPLTIQVNPATGLRIEADCPMPNPVTKTIARWPKAAWPWLNPRLRQASAVPPMDPLCGRPVSQAPEALQILEIQSGAILRPQGAETTLPTISLKALGGRGRLYWLLGGELIAETEIGRDATYQFKRPGRYRLTVLDQAGNADEVEITVLAGGG